MSYEAAVPGGIVGVVVRTETLSQMARPSDCGPSKGMGSDMVRRGSAMTVSSLSDRRLMLSRGLVVIGVSRLKGEVVMWSWS